MTKRGGLLKERGPLSRDRAVVGAAGILFHGQPPSRSIATVSVRNQKVTASRDDKKGRTVEKGGVVTKAESRLEMEF
jgi:hypothetical protein